MSTRYPSTVYSSDPALTKSGVPHPASHSTPLPHISTTTCYPSTLPNNPTPILYVADAPITPEAVGSFYFEVRVEELLPAPRTTSSSTTGRVSTSHHRHRAESEDHVDETPSSVEEDEDDNDIIQRDGPNNPPPLSDKPLTFIVGLTSDRLKMMTTMSTPGLAAKSIGYFNHQQMIYRGSSGGEDVGGIPHDDADDSENYGDVATNDKIDDCDRTYVDEFAAGNGPDQRMRLGRVACVGCLVDFNNSTVRFTKNGTAMPVAALLGHNRHRLASSLQPSSTTTIPTLIPPGHARHYPLVPTTPSSPSPPPPTRSTIYPVVCIPRNCGSQYLIHFTFMGPSSLSTAAVQHAAPLCRFPYTAWVHNEGEKAMRRQVASQTSKYAEEEGSGGGGHTHMLEMIMSHFTLRGMHDVVGTLEREVKAVEEGCPPSPSSSPVQGMPSPSVGASSSNTSCGATPIRIATDRPDSATSPSTTTSSPSSSSTQTATSLHAAYNHIEKGDPMTALHILRSTNLSHLLPPTTDIIIHPPPLTGSHFLSKRWDVVYWITLLQIVIDVVGGMERDGWAQILVGAFDEVDTASGRVMPTSLPSLSSLADQAIPHAYPPPERRQRLAAVNTLLRLISSRPSESRCDTDTEKEDAVLVLLNATRHRVRLCTVAALDTFLHDVRQQWVRMHDVVVTPHQCHEEADEDHPHAPTSTTSATTNAIVTLPPPSSASPGTASSLRALVEDLRANVSLNAMSTSYPATDRPTTTNPLLPTSNRSATHVYARSVAERLGVAGWDEVGGGGDGSVKVFTSSPSHHRGGIPPPTIPAVVVDATDPSPVSSQWMSCSDSDDDNDDEWDEEDEGSSPTTLHHKNTDGTSHLLYAQLPYHDILTTLLMEHLP